MSKPFFSWSLALVVALGAACSSTSSSDDGSVPPAHDTTLPPDGGGPTSDTAAPQPDSQTAGGGFILLVTETPPGPDNGNTATWQGVQRFDVAAAGAELVPGTGIAGDRLADPAGLVYSARLSELFVGNRHGNNAADGVAGSIDRFTFDRTSGSFTPSGRIEGNGLSGVHQLALHPTTGELFAANVNSGVSRFLIDDQGNASPNGTISEGATRGVAVSPDGKWLFVTTAASVIRRFDLSDGSELPAHTAAPGDADLHNLKFLGDALYVTALALDKIFRYSVSAAGELTETGSYPAHSPVSVAFSPDGQEMYAAGHRDTDVINRLVRDGDGWKASPSVSTTSSLGSLTVIE